MSKISWHIEPTSKCILECPLCDRTWFYKKFKKRKLHEINIDHLLNFFNGQSYIIHFCGNNGDPIYHSEFHKLCQRLKETNCTINITTNGSKKSAEWWEQLGSILTIEDKIKFSIDGLQDTNKIYRINSDWDSIMQGFKIMKKHQIKTVWKFIVFKHNQHQIEEAKKLSKELGFDQFQLEKSDRWLDKKELMPNKKYVDDYYKHQSKVLTNTKYQVDIKPKCLQNNLPSRELYIDAEGNFYPCCWIGTYRYKYKSLFSPKFKRFNIKNTTLTKILEDKDVIDFFNSTKQFTSAHECCKIQCGVSNG